MIYINNIPSFRNPENSEFTFDDRVEKVELINDNTVQDYGHVESGDKLSLTCLFSRTNYEQLKILWLNRTQITYIDESGETSTYQRLVFRKLKRHPRFYDYVFLTFELWKV